jgi:hypothetical protein
MDGATQLKELCSNYYEKKTKLGQELLQMLDASINQRPKVLRLKKENFNKSLEIQENPKGLTKEEIN